MEGKLKAALGYSFVKAKRTASGGCINEGLIFDTDRGLIFVKKNNDPKVNILIFYLKLIIELYRGADFEKFLGGAPNGNYYI